MKLHDLIGRTHTAGWTVTGDRLASSLGSGGVDVFATPSMVALMELASRELVQSALPAGITTVGTALAVTHDNPTPPGAEVSAEAELVAVSDDGRRLTFRVTARDEAGVIGAGTHERCTVKAERLEQKAASRRT